MSKSLTMLGFAAFLAVAASPALAVSLPLVSYRAVHDMMLDPAADAPDVSTMNGRVVTEFTGAECAGYTTRTRFVTEATDSDDQRQVVDSRSLTVEKPDGTMTFDNTTLQNGSASDTAKGVATRASGSVQVKLTKPARKTLDIAPDALFPTEQIVRTIEAAEKGEHFLNFTTYDGVDDGETVSPATVIIGPGSTDASDVGDEAPIADAGFATMQHWPITISYFDGGGGADQSPDYSMSALLYENGVMRRLKLNYGRFALVGKLVQLDVLTTPPCP